PRSLPIRAAQQRQSRIRYAVAAIVAVALLCGSVLSGTFWLGSSGEVSAQEIIARASVPALASGDADIQSFVITESRTINTDDGRRKVQMTRWYDARDHWRIESEETVTTETGSSVRHFGAVADGQLIWDWTDDSARVREIPADQQDLLDLAAFGGGWSDLSDALQSASECATPERQPDATVAGRAVYVIDLGESTCPSASMPATNGRRVVSIDKDTFFVLKVVQYDGRPDHAGQVYSTTEVTSVDYNVALEADLFTYSPPAGLPVDDQRVTATATAPATVTPQPEPTSQPSSLDALREQVSYPIFVPTIIPDGLTATEPTGGQAADSFVEIEYQTADGQPGLSVLVGPAGCCLAQAGKDGYAVTLSNGLAAHNVASQPDSPAGILWWNQDGAYIALSGTNLTFDDLLQIAASMSSSAELDGTGS
ncbi:MAG TPA: hypothetical protein VFV93_04700, partial [Thermomicrobiales bacterium]|nr:hypothetical protein [Thermomicrobiales bacterium]